jgi:hypothetical protein
LTVSRRGRQSHRRDRHTAQENVKPIIQPTTRRDRTSVPDHSIITRLATSSCVRNGPRGKEATNVEVMFHSRHRGIGCDLVWPPGVRGRTGGNHHCNAATERQRIELGLQTMRDFPYSRVGRHSHPEPAAVTPEDRSQWPDTAPLIRLATRAAVRPGVLHRAAVAVSITTCCWTG